jgi:ribonuclease Z
VTSRDITGFSRALYANWIWHRPLNLIVDAGEGLAVALGTEVFAPKVVALTHGHSDHVLGLPGFAGSRRFGRGAPDKPWTVVYPEGSSGVDAMRAAIASLWVGVAFPITWIPVRPGARHPLGGNRVLEAFAVAHVPPEPALGFRVIETRRRLKPEYARLPADAIEEHARRHGRDELTVEVAQVLFVHSGDAMPIAADLVRDADLLVHDATFLTGDDRRAPIHATSEEALDVARSAGARALILNHLSIRYDRPTALATLRTQVSASRFQGDCWLLDGAELISLRT